MASLNGCLRPPAFWKKCLFQFRRNIVGVAGPSAVLRDNQRAIVLAGYLLGLDVFRVRDHDEHIEKLPVVAERHVQIVGVIVRDDHAVNRPGGLA